MDVQFSEVRGVTKAVFEGRMDSSSVGHVEGHFIEHVGPRERPAIVDMTAVTFIASLGIRMLLGTARALARDGSKLAMYGANGEVLEVIETTALSEIIPVVRTEAEAIAAVSE